MQTIDWFPQCKWLYRLPPASICNEPWSGHGRKFKWPLDLDLWPIDLEMVCNTLVVLVPHMKQINQIVTEARSRHSMQDGEMEGMKPIYLSPNNFIALGYNYKINRSTSDISIRWMTVFDIVLQTLIAQCVYHISCMSWACILATQIAKFMGANMGPTWVLLAPDGPHVGPMNLAIRASKVVPDGISNYMCNIFSRWLKPSSAIERKHAKIVATPKHLEIKYIKIMKCQKSVSSLVSHLSERMYFLYQYQEEFTVSDVWILQAIYKILSTWKNFYDKAH